eukprot:4134432-Amphidinium_carterae.1
MGFCIDGRSVTKLRPRYSPFKETQDPESKTVAPRNKEPPGQAQRVAPLAEHHDLPSTDLCGAGSTVTNGLGHRTTALIT